MQSPDDEEPPDWQARQRAADVLPAPSSTREQLDAAWLLEARALKRVALLRELGSKPRQLKAALFEVAISHAKAADLIRALKRELDQSREHP